MPLNDYVHFDGIAEGQTLVWNESRNRFEAGDAGGAWGLIGGDINDQPDLVDLVNAKQAALTDLQVVEVNKEGADGLTDAEIRFYTENSLKWDARITRGASGSGSFAEDCLFIENRSAGSADPYDEGFIAIMDDQTVEFGFFLSGKSSKFVTATIDGTTGYASFVGGMKIGSGGADEVLGELRVNGTSLQFHNGASWRDTFLL